MLRICYCSLWPHYIHCHEGVGGGYWIHPVPWSVIHSFINSSSICRWLSLRMVVRMLFIRFEKNLVYIYHFGNDLWLDWLSTSYLIKYAHDKWSCDWLSYMLCCEYCMVGNRYSQLLFANVDRLCTNLRMQEQSTNMASQYQLGLCVQGMT